MINESEAVGGMTTDGGNQCTQRRPPPPQGNFVHPQIPVTELGSPWWEAQDVSLPTFNHTKSQNAARRVEMLNEYLFLRQAPVEFRLAVAVTSVRENEPERAFAYCRVKFTCTRG